MRAKSTLSRIAVIVWSAIPRPGGREVQKVLHVRSARSDHSARSAQLVVPFRSALSDPSVRSARSARRFRSALSVQSPRSQAFFQSEVSPVSQSRLVQHEDRGSHESEVCLHTLRRVRVGEHPPDTEAVKTTSPIGAPKLVLQRRQV